MGQKINPTGFRLSVTKNWTSRWYANNTDFAKMLKEDVDVRLYLKKKLKNASVSKVIIERPAKNARITIYSSRPGVVIGKKGEDIEVLRRELQKRMGVPVHVNIEEIRKPEVDAQLIADSITQQLEKRIMFRRAMKRAMQSAMRLGAQGIKIMSLKADIDYATSEAETTYGIIGVKVWVYKGDTLGRGAEAPPVASAPAIEPSIDDKKSRRAPAKTARRSPAAGDKTAVALDEKPKVTTKPVVKRVRKAVEVGTPESATPAADTKKSGD
jgi:small subunit ribosomal protein S3